MEEIQKRLAELETEIAKPDADLVAIRKEVDELEEQRKAIEERAETVRRITEGRDVRVLRSFTPEKSTPEERDLGIESAEYRSAFLKNLVHETTGDWRFGEINAEERAAFVHTTANTANVVPAAMSSEIIDLITKKYALLGDIDTTDFGGVIEIVQNTGIEQGVPGKTDEGVANEDAQFTFVKINLSGDEYKGHVDISRKLQVNSLEGFEAYLIKTLGAQLGEAMNKDVVAAITSGVRDDNKIAPVSGLTEADIRGALAQLDGAENITVYANNFTIYNVLAGVKDDNGRQYFIESTVTDDPSIKGRIFGAPIKLDNTLENNFFIVGDADTVRGNRFTGLEMMSDRDVKTHATTHSIFQLFEAALTDARALATVTVTPEA